MLIMTQHLAPIDRDQLAAQLAMLSHERLDAAEVDRIYGAMVVHRAQMYGAHRLDANETAILELQLQQMRARTADVQYAEFKARRLVPMTSEIDPGAESWSYAQWDRVGMAKVVANYADDVPMVATFAKKFVQTVESLALGYEWSWLDMLRTAKAGVPLRARKSEAVRTGFEQRIEQIAAIGLPETGLTGFLNNGNVPLIHAAPAAAGGNAPEWDGDDKTPEEKVADLHAMEDAILINTKGVHAPDTLVMPLQEFRHATTTPLTVGNTDPTKTILSVFLAKSKFIRNVEWWTYADDAALDEPIFAMYRRDPTMVHFELPQEQQEQPPQAKNLAMQVLSVGRVGGVAFEYPLSAVYMDSIRTPTP
jgi:hypothetical protein